MFSRFLPATLIALCCLAASSKVRVASFSVASDEILFQLLSGNGNIQPSKKNRFHVSAWSRFVCSADYSYLAEAGYCKKYPDLFAVPKIGDEIETVLKIDPTHAVLASFNRPIYQKILRRKKITTFTLENFRSLSDQFDHIRGVAKVLGVSSLAEKKISALKKKWNTNPVLNCRSLKSINSSKSSEKQKPTVLILATPGRGANTFAQGTLVDDYFSRAGFENLAVSKLKKKGMFKLGAMAQKTLKPDVWVLPETALREKHALSKKPNVLYVSSAVYAGSVLAATHNHHKWVQFALSVRGCKPQGQKTL